MENSNLENFSEEFLTSLLQGNRQNCSSIAKKYLNLNHSFLDLYENIFKVSLYEVGRLWETNRITVASEHLATAITEGILNELFEQIISKKKMNKKVVVACVENEQHQVGIKMVADTFEMHGWESFFLGTGIPIQQLINFIREIKPDLLAISLSVYFNFPNLIKMLERIKMEFPEIQILLGGQAFKNLSSEMVNKIGNVIVLPDLYLLKKYIDLVNSNLNTKDNGKN
jgi:methanogenic corrinoid protein MtbC1